MTKLTISIVNFNAGNYLLGTLESLYQVADELDFEIFVVDNASTDGSLALAKQQYKKVKYIANQENIGFGRAHNQVLKVLKTEYVLILNPDVVVKKGTLSYMLNFLDQHREVGAATCKLIHQDGSLDFAAHRGFPTPLASFLYFLGISKFYHLTDRNFSEVHGVDAISGSFFLTRKEILDKVGVFDEDYFMYAEDIDLSYRIKQSGFDIAYIPSVTAVHFKGISSGLKVNTQLQTTANLETKTRSVNAFYETMKIFYQKHLQEKYPFFINWLVYLGIDLRWWLAKRKLVV